MSTPSERWQNMMSGVLALCALGVVGLMVTRRTAPRTPAESGPPTRVENWAALVSTGQRIGRDAAPITIVEFGDFECPVCGSYHEATLEPFLREHATTAALVYRHWPLTYHRVALSAARASECAGHQGAFEAFHNELYAHQDSLGLRTFWQVAQQAGVQDSMAFTRCLSDPDVEDAIRVDVEAVTALGGTGTPTILINGYQWHGLPSRSQLDSIAEAAQAGANMEGHDD